MSKFFDAEEEETWAIRPNKSQIKRNISVLADLCEEITQLTPAKIECLNLPDNIFTAMIEATKMPHKSARKRQLKFIIGLMRQINIEPIQQALDKLKTRSAHAARELHQLEQLREQFLANDKQILTEFLTQHPEANAQYIRQLICNAKKETASARVPKYSHLLFRYLRELRGNKIKSINN